MERRRTLCLAGFSSTLCSVSCCSWEPDPRTCLFTTALWAEDVRSVQQIHLLESWTNWLSISSYMMSLCNGALCSFLAALEIEGKWVGLGAQWAYQVPRRSYQSKSVRWKGLRIFIGLSCAIRKLYTVFISLSSVPVCHVCSPQKTLICVWHIWWHVYFLYVPCM